MEKMINDKTLEAVAGGVGGFGLTFEQCTRLLYEAGVRAWDRSGYWIMGAFVPDSNLHRLIEAAEKATDNATRLEYVEKALVELENPTYAAFQDLFLKPGDYEYIESRLKKVRLESAIQPIGL